MYLLITYDISSDKRRRKVDKLLSSYGDRVNYSVFELEVVKSEYKKLKSKLKDLIGKNDSIRLYRLDKSVLDSAEELGKNHSNPFEREDSYV